MASFTLGDQIIPKGQTRLVTLPVTQSLDGAAVNICATVINGSQDGPTLALVNLQHGDEWFDIQMMYRLMQRIEPGDLQGRLILLPIANPFGFGRGWRNTQTDADSPDMNRAWPGTHTWLPDLLAKEISRSILPHCDAILDFHPGPWGVAFRQLRYGADFAASELSQRAYDMALAFGCPQIAAGKVMAAFPGPKSLMGYAGSQLGIPVVNISLGGAGFGKAVEEQWLEENIRGIENVMVHLGMRQGRIAYPERVLVFKKVHRVHASIAGLLLPQRSIDSLSDPVQEGELLAQVLNPYSLTVVEELHAPCDGWLAYMPRTYPVQPGTWGFGVIDAVQGEWIVPHSTH